MPPEVSPRPTTVLELLVTLAAAAVGTLLVAAVIQASDITARDPAAGALGPAWAGIMIGLALVGYLVQHRTAPGVGRWWVAVLAGLAVGGVMAPLWAGLHGTPQPPFGVLRGDMTFRTEYITRFASTWHLDDYTFGNLAAFYPPAWFWLAGRAAHLFGIEPWRIVKPFTVGTTGVALALAYLLWRRVLTPAGALAAAIGSSLVLTRQATALGPAAHATQGWYSPYSCFVAVTGSAWLAASLYAVREGASRKAWVLLVLAGALLALCYYLLFIILAVVLVLLAVIPPGERRPAALRMVAILGGVAALTAVFWVPLVLDVLRGGASQGHYLAPDFLQAQVGFDGPAELIVLAIAVVVALVLGSATWPSLAVGSLLVATAVYQVISSASLLFTQNQLQPHRAVTMMWATLGAAVPVGLEAFRAKGSLAGGLPAAGARAVAIIVAVVAVGATFVLGEREGTDLVAGPLTRGAYDPADMARPKRIAEFITKTTHRPAKDLTLLSGDKNAVLVTQPFNGFLALSARYAHPKAHQARRVHWAQKAASCATAACTTKRLEHTPFGPVDALVLTRVPVGYELLTQIDGFPEPTLVTIRFPAERFDPAVWAIRQFGDDVVLARRPHPAQLAPPVSIRGTRRHSPAPVSTRAARPGRRASSARAWSSLKALTPRSSCTRRAAARRSARSAAAGAVHHPAPSIHAPCHSSQRQR